MTISVRGLKNVKSMTNNTCHFGSMSGLPPRVGVPVRILNAPNYGLHCKSTADNPNCCCLPISHTWHLNCKEARRYFSAYMNKPINQVYSGGVGNRCVNMRFC